jgi:hypothetical protein
VGPTGEEAVVVNRIDASNIGGSRLVDVDTSTLTNGTIATVFSVGALFRLVKNPTAQLIAQIDGITVVASTASPGSIWVRVVTTSDPRFAANMPLFINPSAGNDDNDGLTAPTALKTADEWSRRMNGQELPVGFSATIALAAGNNGDFGNCKLVLKNPVGSSVLITILGAKTVSAEVGTVSSVVAQNTATQTEYQFTDSSGVGPVISVGSRLRIVGSATPANIGGVGYVRGFDGGGATNPFTSVFTNPAGTEFFPAPTDTYVVETLTSQVIGDAIQIQGLSGGVGQIIFEDCMENVGTGSSFPVVSAQTDLYGLNNSTNFTTYFHCQFGSTTTTRIRNPGQLFVGCEFLTAIDTQGLGTQSFTSCLFRAGGAFGCSITRFTGNNVSEGSVTGNATTAGICAMAANSPFLLSRIGAAVGIEVVINQTWSLGQQVLWSPPLGARNAMTVAVQVDSHGIVQANNFATSLGSLSASIFPVTVCGKEVDEFYVDTENGAYISTPSPGGGGTGGIEYIADISAMPVRSPVGGAFLGSTTGGQLQTKSPGGQQYALPLGQVGTKTTLTSSFVMPAVNATVIAVVKASILFSVNDPVLVGSNRMSVTAVTDATHITLLNTGSSTNQAPGATVANASEVRPILAGEIAWIGNVAGTFTGIPCPDWGSCYDARLRAGAGGGGSGGGGAGGFGATGAGAGGGGGGGKGGGPGGACSSKVFFAIPYTTGDTMTIVVGAGGAQQNTVGAAGAAGGAGGAGTNGNQGGLTTIATTTAGVQAISGAGARGGAGGQLGGASSAGTGAAGGAGGSTFGNAGAFVGSDTTTGTTGQTGGTGGGVTGTAGGNTNGFPGGVTGFVSGTNPVIAPIAGATGGAGNGVAHGGGGAGGAGGPSAPGDEWATILGTPGTSAGSGGVGGHGADADTNANGTAGSPGVAGTNGRGGGGGGGGGAGGAIATTGGIGFAGGTGGKGSDGLAEVRFR